MLNLLYGTALNCIELHKIKLAYNWTKLNRIKLKKFNFSGNVTGGYAATSNQRSLYLLEQAHVAWRSAVPAAGYT